MEIKALTLSTLLGASLSLTQFGQAALAQHASHAQVIITPIICDLIDESRELGAFSRFSTAGHSHVISFGVADGLDRNVWAGARVDAIGQKAGNWRIVVDFSASGEQDIFFITSLKNSTGIEFKPDVDSNLNHGVLTATFNANEFGFTGDKFQSIYVYSSGSGYTDLIDLVHGVSVNGIAAIPNPHAIAQNDCTGFTSLFN